ncbi:MAG: hypothetical protein HQL51_10940 [Magnetococcales bacterium]|nr:hypothetical protein [Magnetococcales bacterium]
MQEFVWYWINAVLLLMLLISFAYIGYIHIRKSLYTKSRYAFAALSAQVMIAISALRLAFSDNPFEIIEKIISSTGSVPSMQFELGTSDKVLILIFSGFAMRLFYEPFKRWDGNMSQNPSDLLVFEGINEFKRLVKLIPPLPDSQVPTPPSPPPLPIPSLNQAWHQHIRELIELKHPSIRFNALESWHEEESCWVGENIHTNQPVVLLCLLQKYSDDALRRFERYIYRVLGREDNNVECFVVVDGANGNTVKNIFGKDVTILSEDMLLDDLVDFSNYFRKIKKRVEEDKLPDAAWTIKDIFTDGRIIEEDDQNQTPRDMERYLRNWLITSEQKQLAILGEYGQGKSTGMLMFAYRLIKEKGKRLPVLIELRGRSPSTLPPMELLAAWGSSYGIQAKALMKLHQAGRLLLILEGFDEMAEASASEARYNHFVSLWQFCYPKAKIIFTGRPNFFLDDKELRNLLGVSRSVAAGPYTHCLDLVPFDFRQMEESLRQADQDVREEIVALAKKDQAFLDIVSRPSLLYLVCILWRMPELQDHRENLTSAHVIGLFLQHLYRRQEEKVRDSNRHYMMLSNEERSYFMDGVAAYMVVNRLENQISRQKFLDVITMLYDRIPESIPSVGAIVNGMPQRPPLKKRLLDSQDPYEVVETDVRACGILVPDPARSGALRFPHKSFFEFLVAKYMAELVNNENIENRFAIRLATGASLKHLANEPQCVVFFSDILWGKFSVASGGRMAGGASVHELNKLAERLFGQLFGRDGELLSTAYRLFNSRFCRRVFLCMSKYQTDVFPMLILFLLVSIPVMATASIIGMFRYDLHELNNLAPLFLCFGSFAIAAKLLLRFGANDVMLVWLLVLDRIGATRITIENFVGRDMMKKLEQAYPSRELFRRYNTQ